MSREAGLREERADIPAQIIIRASSGDAYAWTEAGDCLGRSGWRMVAEHFMDYACLSALVDLEYELWDWSRRLLAAQRAEMHWQDFHVQGLVLAQRLANLLRPLGVSVHYRCGNPLGCGELVCTGPL